MNMATLVRNWRLMAIRGGLAIVFGLSVLAWPNMTLPIVVVLFGIYAILDGVWAVMAAIRASERLLDAWPVGLEGLVSAALGVVALWRPFVSREFILVVAGWGIATGLLEVVAAASLPARQVGHWLLGTGGVSSLFLAVLILLLPHADLDSITHLIGVYALVFGALVLVAAVRFSQRPVAGVR